jgi:hypothetical protein
LKPVKYTGGDSPKEKKTKIIVDSDEYNDSDETSDDNVNETSDDNVNETSDDNVNETSDDNVNETSEQWCQDLIYVFSTQISCLTFLYFTEICVKKKETYINFMFYETRT